LVKVQTTSEFQARFQEIFADLLSCLCTGPRILRSTEINKDNDNKVCQKVLKRSDKCVVKFLKRSEKCVKFWKSCNVARRSSLSSWREDFEAHSNGSLLKPIDLAKNSTGLQFCNNVTLFLISELSVVRLLMIDCFSILCRLIQVPCISHILLKLPVLSSDTEQMNLPCSLT